MKIYTIMHSKYNSDATFITVIANSKQEAIDIFYKKYNKYDINHMRNITEKPLKKGIITIELP